MNHVAFNHVAFPDYYTVTQEFVDCMSAVGAYDYKLSYEPLTMEYRLIVFTKSAGILEVVAKTLDDIEDTLIRMVREKIGKPYSPRLGWCQDDGWGE